VASLHKQAGNRPGYKLRFRTGDGRQRVLWLGDVSKRNANTIARHVTELVEATEGRVTADVDTTKWANELTGRLRQRLAEWGYVGAERRNNDVAELRLCGPFFNAYIASRTDLKPNTRTNYQQAADAFVRYAGKNRLLSDVTAADVDKWRLWLVAAGISEAIDDEPAKGYAQSTANKHAKRIKKLFAQAVRAKLIAEDPTADQKIGGEVNRDRDFYVGAAVAATIVKHCQTEADPEWALIFGLCRYAGFRCPTEVLGLTWDDVNWAENRLRVDSPKTGLRFCPIFPELRPLLDNVYHAAEPGLHCIRRYRGRESNLRTQLHRILIAAGVVPWPKTFVNLRASCRTDLQERFPDHVVNTWLGQSSRVAERHYLQTTEAHWERAITEPANPIPLPPSDGGNAGGNIPANLAESGSP